MVLSQWAEVARSEGRGMEGEPPDDDRSQSHVNYLKRE